MPFCPRRAMLIPVRDSSKNNRKPGAALVVVLLVLTLLLVVGLAFLSVSGADYVFARHQQDTTGALYLALAGVEYASREGWDWTGSRQVEFCLAAGTCRVEAGRDPQSGRLLVTATGRQNGAQRVVVASLDEGVVVEWHEP